MQVLDEVSNGLRRAATQTRTSAPRWPRPSARSPTSSRADAMVPTLTSKRDAPSRTRAPAAVDLARAALEEVAEPGTVGAHSGMEMLGERLAMHWFECTSPGYHGWRWGVSVARVPRMKAATVCETNLLPGPEAVLAPEWLPYADRLAPGDLGAGDVLPRRPDDPNLEAGFEATGDEDVDQMAFFELGLGRPRCCCPRGATPQPRAGTPVRAARRRRSPRRPPPAARRAATSCRWPARCGPSSVSAPTSGARPTGASSRSTTGAGAHSETDVEQPEPTPIGEPIVDEFAVDLEQVLPTDDDATSPEDFDRGGGGGGRAGPGSCPVLEGEAAGAEAEEGVVRGTAPRRPASGTEPSGIRPRLPSGGVLRVAAPAPQVQPADGAQTHAGDARPRPPVAVASCRAGTTRVTTSATAHVTMPASTILSMGTWDRLKGLLGWRRGVWSVTWASLGDSARGPPRAKRPGSPAHH